jgi:superfamily I DNA/RNA helicase
MEPSAEQQAVVDAPLGPLAVVACAGSGKTTTAIRRLVAMRRLLGEARGRVALLSFSNVAIDTFRRGYRALAEALPNGTSRSRVEIDTLDGFITSHILRPHAYRTMGAPKAAFLVTGNEPFLDGFTCRTKNFPIPVTKIKVGINEGELFFFHDYRGNVELLDRHAAAQVVTRLGQSGAYTHDLGRYWCYRTLVAQPELLRVLAWRYPHVLVDEAQDIGSLHQAILELLAQAGVQVSLIGDPNQGIYEFAGADGNFLRNYHQREGVSAFALTRNYRSLPPIVTLANGLAGRVDEAHRAAEPGANGAYFVGYTALELPRLLDAFHTEVAYLGVRAENAAILCRAAPLAAQLAGVIDPAGRGLVKIFAKAALLRDMHCRFFDAFREVARGIVSLLASPPQGLLAKVCHAAHDPSLRDFRRRLWTFTRDADHGLPSSELIAVTRWHPLLVERVRALLESIERDFGLEPIDNLGRRLARTELPATPLNAGVVLAAARGPRIRVDTVHQVKGESIDAVLYVATRQHIQAMLDGVGTEVGRIGYVAMTRARNVLWLGVPANALGDLRPALVAAGYQEVGAGERQAR